MAHPVVCVYLYLYNDLRWSLNGQVSSSSIPLMYDMNSMLPDRWKTCLAWVEVRDRGGGGGGGGVHATTSASSSDCATMFVYVEIEGVAHPAKNID